MKVHPFAKQIGAIEALNACQAAEEGGKLVLGIENPDKTVTKLDFEEVLKVHEAIEGMKNLDPRLQLLTLEEFKQKFAGKVKQGQEILDRYFSQAVARIEAQVIPSAKLWSHHLFRSQISCLALQKYCQVGIESGRIIIGIKNPDKTISKVDFESHFSIHRLILEKKKTSSSPLENWFSKLCLEDFKAKLITHLKRQKGYFGSLSEEETKCVDAYFSYMQNEIFKPEESSSFWKPVFSVVGHLAAGAAIAYVANVCFSQK